MTSKRIAKKAGNATQLLLSLIVLACAAPLAGAEELQQRQVIQSLGRQVYETEGFAALDVILAKYLSSKARTSSGLWKVGFLEDGIETTTAEENAVSEQDWKRLEEKAQRWIAANPKSPFARINLALVVKSHAWSFRGSEYAEKVPQTAWKPFFKELARARRILDEAKSIADVDPAWYALAIEIAKADGRKRSEVDALFNEAMAREPDYYPVYFAMLDYLLPKWNGDPHQIEIFANQAVARTRSVEGNSMYARIYWGASEGQFQNHLFMSSFARWKQVDAGFKDILARYPDQWNLNHYAKFACLAGDMKRTRELIAKIDQPIDEAWEPEGLFERCRNEAGLQSL